MQSHERAACQTAAMRMSKAAAAVVACVASLVLVGSGPASALRSAVVDPAGDASGPGLDITRAVVRNGERAVVARVTFSEAVRGDLIVSIDPRRARGVRLVSEHRPAGVTRSYALRGAFTDQGGFAGRVDCPGFRVEWDTDTEVARMRLPSRCLRGGDYGAIRFSVLTERGGGDTDFAPEGGGGDIGSSDWISRG